MGFRWLQPFIGAAPWSGSPIYRSLPSQMDLNMRHSTMNCPKWTRLRRTLIVLSVVSMLTTIACPLQDNPDASRRLSKSLLIETAKTFYSFKGGKLTERSLTHSDLRSLQAELNSLMTEVLDVYQAHYVNLSTHFELHRTSHPVVKVILADLTSREETHPYAGGTVDPHSGDLQVTTNVAFLRTLLRSAVIESVKAPAVSPYPADDKMCSDNECVARFMEFVAMVDHGRLPKGTGLYAALEANKAEKKFSGTVYFTLAHELGHYMLAHDNHPCDAPQCTVFRSDEFDADEFAAYLLSMHLMLTSGLAVAMFDQTLGLSDLVGFPQFFERAYPRLGFGQSLCDCQYPSPSEREENANAAFEDATKGTSEIQKDVLKQKVDSIKSKYANVRSESSPSTEITKVVLFPSVMEKKVGFMDNVGMVHIPPQYSSASDFSDGLAQVGFSSDPTDVGFIDQEGHVQFHVPKYWKANKSHISHVGDFHMGRARVEYRQKTEESTYGYLDKNGTIVIQPDFAFARDFSEGLAAVQVASPVKIQDDVFGYIDRNGKFVIEPHFSQAHSFSEGLAAVREKILGQWEYIDMSGHTVLSALYDQAWDFHEGLALVEDGNGWNHHFISKAGEVIGQQIAGAYDFSEGVAAVNIGGKFEMGSNISYTVKRGSWSYMDTSGKIVSTAKYNCARPFSEGLAAVSVQGWSDSVYCLKAKWGFINKKGDFVIPPRFDYVYSDFVNGLAQVSDSGKVEYINSAGAIVTPKQ